MKKLRTVLCCDGPYNGEYVESSSPHVGFQFTAPFHWGEGRYECVEWPTTGELVAYWRPADASD